MFSPPIHVSAKIIVEQLGYGTWLQLPKATIGLVFVIILLIGVKMADEIVDFNTFRLKKSFFEKCWTKLNYGNRS